MDTQFNPSEEELNLIADLVKKTGASTIRSAEINHGLAQLISEGDIDHLGFLWLVVIELLETCLTFPGSTDKWRQHALSLLQQRISKLASRDYRGG